MLDLALFRYPRFVGVQVLPIGTCYCYIVLLVLLPLRFIGVNGLHETDAGMLMLALSAPMLVVPTFASWLTRWLSPGLLSGTGLLIAAAGLYLLSRVAIRETSGELVLPMLLIGCGTGFAISVIKMGRVFPFPLPDAVIIGAGLLGVAAMAAFLAPFYHVTALGSALYIIPVAIAIYLGCVFLVLHLAGRNPLDLMRGLWSAERSSARF